MSFDCRKCGACCRLVGSNELTRGLDRGDGACRYLQPDNLCSIYDERPDICRVDRTQPSVMTTHEWHRRNHAACDQLHLRVYGQPLQR